jgi:hypothetical protein
MPLVSREITSVPESLPEEARVWLEKILNDHYRDIKAIRNQLLINIWRLEEDETTGNYKVMQWNETTEVWDFSGEELVKA